MMALIIKSDSFLIAVEIFEKQPLKKHENENNTQIYTYLTILIFSYNFPAFSVKKMKHCFGRTTCSHEEM